MLAEFNICVRGVKHHVATPLQEVHIYVHAGGSK